MSFINIDWNDLLKKEARCINDKDLGEVQNVDHDYVLTQKGMPSNKEKFYLPKYLVEKYDGITIWFRLSEQEDKFKVADKP